MMKFLLCFVLVAFLSSTSVAALKIFGISTIPSPSHHLWFTHLMNGLAKRGHQIYTLGLQPVEIGGDDVMESQITSFVFEGAFDKFRQSKSFDPLAWSRMSTFEMSRCIYDHWHDDCKSQMNTTGAKQALEFVKSNKIDVIVQDLVVGQCFYGLWEVAKGGPVIVGFTPFGSPNWVKDVVGGHNWPAIKHFHNVQRPPSTLWERTLNVVHYEVDDFLRRFYHMPVQQKLAEEFIGTKMNRSIVEVEKRVSIMLTNSYPALDPAIFLPPNVIQVGGLHVGDPKPLPQDIQKFLDEAEHGVVVISMGTNVQSSTLGPKKLEAIVGALSQLKQRVLWKFETDDLKNKPENVMIKKWLPQSSVLAHPKVRVLWTHAGLLSTQEAVWRGVPVIGMPFFLDQHSNIDNLVKKGVGLQLDFESLSSETISGVMDRILNDQSYSLRMKELSREYRDRPMSPLDLAVWHIEYASRNPRAPLASPARNMSSVQFNLLDVYAVLGAAVLSILLSFWIFVRILINLFRRPRKNQDRVKAKRN